MVSVPDGGRPSHQARAPDASSPTSIPITTGRAGLGGMGWSGTAARSHIMTPLNRAATTFAICLSIATSSFLTASRGARRRPSFGLAARSASMPAR